MPTHAPTFELSAGATCLDFANTVSDRPRCRSDRLRSYQDLLAWGLQARTLEEGIAGRLELLARERPEAARRTLRTAIALREAIYRIFAAIASGGPPPPRELARLNRALARAMARLRVAAEGDGFRWRWDGEPDAFDRALWPVARCAAELLASADRDRVRECAGRGCSWLFLDRSPARSRRWCDMASCGNRAKARRHYHRTRG